VMRMGSQVEIGGCPDLGGSPSDVGTLTAETLIDPG
jgi:hypothetical protein